MTENPQKSVSAPVFISKDLHFLIKTHATAQKTTMSAVVEGAVRDYFESQKKQEDYAESLKNKDS